MRQLITILLLLLCMSDCGVCDILLTVKESEGISRSNEMVHNGVPIAKAEAITSTASLIVTDSIGTQIPATFEVLSRWNGDPDDSGKEIQWLLVSFPSSVGANQMETYYLKTGTPEALSSALNVSNSESTVVVDTGPAEFVISKTTLSIFESVSLGGVNLLSGGGGATSTINGQSAASANAPTLVEVERSDENYACVKVEGIYANTPVGTSDAEPLYYRIRYEFYAGSPTAIVTHKFWWAGDTGTSTGAITVDSVINSLPVMTGLSSAEVYADATTYQTGALSSGSAKVEQKRKTLHADPSLAVVTHGSNTSNTTYATRPMLLAKNTNGTIAVSLDHMHSFEPQALEVTSGGSIKISPLAEGQYLANRQGTWARFSVSALPANVSYNDTLAVNFAPLNKRLFAFPPTSYVNTTKVFGSVPDAASGPVTSTFISKMNTVANYSRSFMETQKFQGLMTWGSMTRYPGEVGSASSWDKIYSGANLTDYHSTSLNYVFNYLYTGDVNWLYDISFNAARRMVNTQVYQPDSTVSSARMGWGFSGYNRYRSDQNSSHTYFENLYAYYYLTGDKEVIDIVKIGANTKRGWYTRTGGTLAAQDSYLVDWVTYSDRADMQAASMFNFIGHVYDSSYIDDFEYMFRHMFSTEIVMLSNGDGKEYGFVVGKEPLDGSVGTGQIWMVAIYNMPYLDILYRERGDLSLGVGNITISRFIMAIANGAIEYYGKVSGTGDWNSYWANAMTVNYSGDAIGGTITSVTLNTGSDQYIYWTGKGPTATLILNAGRLLNDTALIDKGKAGLEYMMTTTEWTAASTIPFAKEHGIAFTRTHSGFGEYYEIQSSCIDGVQNGDETWVDCGGSCPACSQQPSSGKRYHYRSIIDN